MIFKVNYHTKWADFDANKHMRHTAYNDYAAACRIRFFNQHGFGVDRFEKENFGPILFKEETSFLKEIKLGEDISVDLFLKGMSEKGERFKMLHNIYKQDGTIAAKIKIYAAWIDLEKRKLTTPPNGAIKMFKSLQRSEDYQDILIKSKS